MKNLLLKVIRRGNAPLTVLVAAFVALLSGCEDNPSTPNLFDPTYTGGPAPTLTAVAPADSAQAGVDTLFLTGTNFSTVPSNNFVYLNTSVANVIAATATQLTVITPLVSGDSISINVAVQGSPKMSNGIVYKLRAAAVKFGGLGALEVANGVATDAAGNLYVEASINGVDQGISKITPAGVRSTFAPAASGTAKWSALKMGPGGFLYAGRNTRAVFRYPVGGGGIPSVWSAFPAGTFIADFDFDQSQNMWAGGDNTLIYEIKQNNTFNSFPFTGTIHSIRVFNGALYFSALKDSTEKIWTAQITGDNIATPTVYYDFGAAFPQDTAKAITFSSDGTMYIATSAPEFLVIVTPAKAPSAPFTAYSTVFGTSLSAFAWGSGDALYSSSTSGGLFSIKTRKTSAPYYGP